MSSSSSRSGGGILLLLAGLGVGVLLAWSLAAWRLEQSARQQREQRIEQLLTALEEAEETRFALQRAGDRQAVGRLTRIRQLERELLRAKRDAAELRAALARLAEDRDAVPELPAGFDPEEQRRATERLRTLNDALRRSGLGRYRFLDFQGGEAGRFEQVDLLETDLEGIVRGDYSADAMTLQLDREAGLLKVVMADAVQIWRGKRRPLGSEHVLELVPQRPRELAEALKGLVELTGEWPAEEPDTAQRAHAVRVAWKERFGRLLREARDEGRYTLFELRGVEGYEFRTVTLLAYSEKGLLERRIRADRMRVYVDREEGTVELRFFGGFVEGREGRFAFPEQWYRLPLPKIRPEQAERELTGAVFREGAATGSRR